MVERFVLDGQQARLTQAALETLAVVAYKQPVSRSRVSAIRGVNVDGVMRTLMTRGLVEEAGTDQETGAHLYRTTATSSSGSGSARSTTCPTGAVPARQRRLRGRPVHQVADEVDAPESGGATPGAPWDHGGVSGRQVDTDDEGLIRLQKLLAQSGVASRRKCEELMLAGAVEVDGEVVTRLGTKVDPTTAVIRVEGRRLPPVSAHVYLVLNKPRGVVSTMSDLQGRPTLGDLVADHPERLFHVGRLDTDTEGLILLTNDGDFAQRLAHPSYEVDKTYVAEVAGRRTPQGDPAAAGGRDARGRTGERPLGQGRSSRGERSIVEMVIHEGRNRIVRRLLDDVGHPVRQLTRTQVGPVRLAGLAQGELRELTPGRSARCSTRPACERSSRVRCGSEQAEEVP